MKRKWWLYIQNGTYISTGVNITFHSGIYCINILTASTKYDYILGELINMSDLISEQGRQEGADLSAEGKFAL